MARDRRGDVGAGYGLTTWAMFSNAFFSTAVRIQSELGHTVCRSGPYRYVRPSRIRGVRAPVAGMCFLLGSLWALLPALVAIIAMVIRTALEDRTLQAELPGYREYAQEVHYRLVGRLVGQEGWRIAMSWQTQLRGDPIPWLLEQSGPGSTLPGAARPA